MYYILSRLHLRVTGLFPLQTLKLNIIITDINAQDHITIINMLHLEQS